MVTSLLLAASLAAGLAGGPSWPTDLAYPGTGLWTARLPVLVSNLGDAPLAGYPVELEVAALTGRAADALRVGDDDGAELLWDLRADGRRVDRGPIPPGAVLTVPATAPRGGRQRLWVYFDNPTAYHVPEFLAAGARPANLSFEDLDGGGLLDWRFDAGDAAHRLAVDQAVARTGERSVRCEVSAGAEPSWIAARQTARRVVPGATYRLTGWVRARDVVGGAGWYVHVATPENPQAVSIVEPVGDGTFEWRSVTIEFAAPAGAVSMSYGTVLRGTGVAWFDDWTVEELDAPPVLRVEVGEVERLDLTVQPVPAPEVRILDLPRDSPRQRGPSVTLWVPNLAEGEVDTLVAANLGRPELLRRSRGLRTLDLRITGRDGQPVEYWRSAGQTIIFAARLAPRTLHAFLADTASVEMLPPPRHGGLLDRPLNRAENGSFEAGAALPEAWPGGSEQPRADGVTFARVPGGPFGEWCSEVRVPATATADWVGWRQRVPVRPGESYLLSAWVQTVGADGPVQLHGHFRTADGELAERAQYWSSGGAVSGDQDWTELSGLVTIPPGCELFELHLTANCHGTIRHDGVLFAPVVVARVGELESPAPEGLAVWPVDPLRKVFRGTPAGQPVEQIELSAARGERESLQLCLRAGQARRVRVSVDLDGLPAPRIERVGYVPCLEPGGYFSSQAAVWERRKPSGGGRTDGWRGWWPDPLLPVDGPVSLAAGVTQPLWLTFAVPPEAEPGVHLGEIRLDAGGETIVLPLRLTVWHQVLPERPSLEVIYDLRNGPGPRAFDSPEQIAAWWRFMAERRISSDRLLPDPVFERVDDRLTIDTAAFDAAASVYFDELNMATAYWPPIFYAAGWAYPPRDFLGTQYPSREYDSTYSEAVRLFAAHLRQRGWFDRMVLYVSDEPHVWDRERGADVTAWLAHVIGLTRAVDPAIPVYSSTWQPVPAWEGVLNHWGIGQYGNFPLETLAARRAAGDKVWFTTDGQMEIDTPYLACERLLPWYCFAHDVSGYEFWGLSWWTWDPFEFGWHRYISQGSFPGDQGWVRYPNSDGYLAYPGDDGPLSSIRLEQAREGIEDYDLLRALAARQADDPRVAPLLAEARALAFIPNAGGFRSTDILPEPERLTDLRRRAGELLDELPR